MKHIIDLSNGEVFKSRGSAAVKYDIHQMQLHRLMDRDDFFIMFLEDFEKYSQEHKTNLLKKHAGKNNIEFRKSTPTSAKVKETVTIKTINAKLDYIISLLEKS